MPRHGIVVENYLCVGGHELTGARGDYRVNLDQLGVFRDQSLDGPFDQRFELATLNSCRGPVRAELLNLEFCQANQGVDLKAHDT